MRHPLPLALTLALLVGSVPALPCTVVYYADEETALAGNNEDFFFPYTQATFFPPEEGKHGGVYFGYQARHGVEFGAYQGGVNDQGLFMIDFWNSAHLSCGCMAAGRAGGYIYVNWNGDVTPCVFVPSESISVTAPVIVRSEIASKVTVAFCPASSAGASTSLTSTRTASGSDSGQKKKS